MRPYRNPLEMRGFYERLEMSKHILSTYLLEMCATEDIVLQYVRQVLPEGAEEPMGLRPCTNELPEVHNWIEPIEAFLGDGIE